MEPRLNPIAPELKIIRDARNPDGRRRDATLWKAISNSIRRIDEQLIAWGQQINSPFDPDLQTVSEAAEGLHQLENELVALEFWLAPRTAPRWDGLQKGLNRARATYWSHEIKSAFYAYVRWVRNNSQPSAADEQTKKWYDEQRSIAGLNIVEFAHALDQAIQTAQIYSL